MIRTATAHDLKRLKELYWLLDGDAIHYQPEHFLQSQRPDDFLLDLIEGDKSDFLLLEADNKVIGFSLIMEKDPSTISCLKKERYGYILDFVIDEGYRSMGYGAKLLDASKQWAKDRQLDFLRLSVFPKNERGIAFYKRHGLTEKMKTMEMDL